MPLPTLPGSTIEWLPSPTSCFQDVGGSTPAGVGNPVYTVKDTTATFLLQATSNATRPTLQQDSGGRYYLSFDGVQDILLYTGTLWNGATKIGWGIAAQLTNCPGPDAMLLRADHATNTTAHGCFTEDGHTIFHARSSGASLIAYRYNNLVPNQVTVAQQLWDLTADTISTRFYGSGTGTATVSGATMTPGNLVQLAIGANSGTAASWAAMNLYDLVIGNGAWSGTDQANLETYQIGTLPTYPYPAASLTSLSAPQQIFTNGTEDPICRIPAICWYNDGTANGVIIAACEGKQSTSDLVQTAIIMKRSTNLGVSWGTVITAASNGTNIADNTVLIPDAPRGKIHLIFCKEPTSDGAPPLLSTQRKCWYSNSTDGGLTWSSAVDISSSVQPAGTKWFATGPGQGVLLANGRIVVGCNFAISTNASPHYQGLLIYSDDGGTTWNQSAAYGPIGANECSVTLCQDGGVYVFNRNQNFTSGGAGGAPYLYYSPDGSTVPANLNAQNQFTGTPCQSAFVCAGNRLFWSYVTASGRNCISVLSCLSQSNPGNSPTWDAGTEITYAETAPPISAGYSSMCLLPNGNIAILYEFGVAGETFPGNAAGDGIYFQTFTPVTSYSTCGVAWL